MTCCNGNCNQGRTCPTRQACELPEDSPPTTPLDAAFLALGIAIALVFLAVLIATALVVFTR